MVMIERQNKPKKMKLRTHFFTIIMTHFKKFNHFPGINQPFDTLLLSDAKARAEAQVETGKRPERPDYESQ
jgi:hypothetical protein